MVLNSLSAGSPCPPDSLTLAEGRNIWARGSRAQVDLGQSA